MLQSVALPPGVFANGTDNQGKGRYHSANLIRFADGTIRPVGGWRVRGTAETIVGKARSLFIWRDNDGVAWISVGTHSGLYIMDRAANIYDITPAGFVAGDADSTFRGGYGNGLYGAGAYGTARPDTTTPTDVTVWTQDSWGEDLVGTANGPIYTWERNTANLATEVVDAPTARAISVTADRILHAYGADGNPRKVQWSDQEDNTEWTPSTTNYAGDFDLQTSGRIMCGRRVRDGHLILTDVDAWFASFLGFPAVYGFDKRGQEGSGIIAQGAVATIDGTAVPVQAVWMGSQGFWGFNGYVEQIESDVADRVFSDINRSQQGKVTAFHNSDYGEVWWFYPSKSSTEIDRYVCWSYLEGHWSEGELTRLSGAARGPLRFPLMVDDDGQIWEHEVGFDYSGAVPELETAFFTIGNGDRVTRVRELIPDERNSGDVTVTVLYKDRPNSTPVEDGPYSMTEKVDLRIEARQIALKYEAARLADFRIGDFDLEIVPGGMR
jgi:hypothetical protein